MLLNGKKVLNYIYVLVDPVEPCITRCHGVNNRRDVMKSSCISSKMSSQKGEINEIM